MPPERLIIVTPALLGGGIEKSMPVLIKSLNWPNPNEIIWIGINKSQYEGYLPVTQKVSLNRESQDGILKTFVAFLKLRRLVLAIEKPTVVVNGELAEIMASLLPRRLRVIPVEHASRPWIHRRWLGYLVRKVLAGRVRTWVTVNSNQEEIWPGIKNFSYIPNPVLQSSLKSKDETVGLVHVGRITTDKGIEVVCKAAIETGLNLEVYGSGVLLEKLIAYLRPHSNITFHGFVAEPWDLIGSKKLFISASLHEGDGRNVAEAVMRRQPVLLLDTPDHRRFCLPEMNYFSDAQDLVEKIFENDKDEFVRLKPTYDLAKSESLKRNPEKVAAAWNVIIEAER